MNQTEMLALAQCMGYQKYTPLQEKAFGHPATYDPAANLLAVGPTSSGKTLIPLLLYCAMYKEALENGTRHPKMLFIVPYRALAAQKCLELRQKLRRALPDIDPYVTQSTAEYRQSDEAILQGEADIAVVINEKAFLFARSDSHFLQQYDLVVLDEIGLLADQSRGIKLDFLLAWCTELRQKGNGPRMIALGTPFYEWNAYAEKFDFTLIASEGRPTLKECPVYIGGNSATRLVDMSAWPEDCRELANYSLYRAQRPVTTPCPLCGELCSTDTPCRLDPSLTCTVTGEPCPHPMRPKAAGVPFLYHVIADLCRWHLEKKHQILIFWNNQDEVSRLCKYLYQTLKDLLRTTPELEKCKEFVLKACTDIANQESDLQRTETISEDEFFGILDDDHYRALYSGVGFHSSAVPLELRSFVENRFLNNGRLKIVCCTETLGYGINSATDAVIIADMYKNTPEASNKFLEANEYQNYIGRCGRLRPGENSEAIVGYVHPILHCFSPNSPHFDPDIPTYRHWTDMKEKSRRPIPIHSCIFEKDNDYIPFLLLCLIPDETEEPRSPEELQHWIARLPKPADRELYDLQSALDYLTAHGLITDVREDPFVFLMPDQMDTPQYRVAYGKKNLCGFTPGARDFDIILKALQHSFLPDGSLCRALLIYHLMQADCMKSNLIDISLERRGRTADDEVYSAEAVSHASAFDPFCAENLPAFFAGLPVSAELQPLLKRVGLKKNDNRSRCIMTAIVLCWAESANPKQLHQWFGVAYPLIQATTRSLQYLLQIAAECMYAVPRLKDETEEHYTARQAELPHQLSTLERSVSLGLQPALYSRLLTFFKQEAETSEAAAGIYAILCRPQPGTARQLRRIFSSYTVWIEALKNQSKGRGADNHSLLRSALRELRSLEKQETAHSLWSKFAAELKNEVLTHDQ